MGKRYQRRHPAFGAIGLYLLMAAGGVLGCSPEALSNGAPSVQEPRDPGAWASDPQSTGFVSLRGNPSTCRECLRAEPFLFLGDDTQENSYVSQPNLLWDAILRDSAGNYWISHRTAIKVFDGQGRYLRDVGHQGQGPMEFQLAVPRHVDSSGFVHVIDPVNARVTILGRDFDLVEMKNWPVFSNKAAPLADGQRWAVPAMVQQPDRMGYPLHITEGAEIIHSFGIPANGSEAAFDRRAMRRRVASDYADRVYSAEHYDYRIEAWTPSGERILGIEGPKLNEKPLDNLAPTSADNPPPNLLVDLAVDKDGLLWILFWDREEDWLDANEERLGTDGTVQLVPIDPIREGTYDSRIDVVDLNKMEIVARMTDERLLWKFIGDRIAAGPTYDPEHDVRIAIWNLDLAMTRSGERR